ncbi:MAG: hypothetical protein M1820_007767 [Bogoriella megaspora]|nr:MAG: hypothetical protein M1820_007767 [Bogoriella megaspora]
MTSRPAAAPFSKAVINAMRQLYPEHLADKSWDNTGLLLEAPFDPLRRQMNSVLLTVDLTKAVADEAIDRNDSVIIAYHPIIFKGLKSLTLANSQQQSLLRLAAEGISVYSPHTAIDAAPGGLGDWLSDIITGMPVKAPQRKVDGQEQEDGEPERDFKSKRSDQQNGTAGTQDDPFMEKKRPVYMLQHHPSQAEVKEPDLKLLVLPILIFKKSDAFKHTRSPIIPMNSETHPGAGMGRVVRFEKPQPLLSLIERIGRGLGNPKGFPIAIPQGQTLESIAIRSVGICAGSGGSLLSGLDVDLLFTGELSHHEALAAIEKGQCVIALFHSNTERGFLHSVLREQLQNEIAVQWETVRREEWERLVKEGIDDAGEWREALEDGHIDVEVSEIDRDPYGIMISKVEL